MDVSVITINYNNSDLTVDFVNSVLSKTSKNLAIEIIVVDNCSATEDYNKLRDKLIKTIHVKLIRNNVNSGFGAGNMLGTLNAKGKYFAFVNNDIIFKEDCFSSLFNFMNDHSNVGVCTPQQLNANSEPVSCFDYFHGIRKLLLGRKFIELFMAKEMPRRANKLYTETCFADFIQGCFMFFNAKSFAKVGGFDTNIFLYYEEMDICFRLKRMGFKSCLFPETKFLHYHGVSTGKSFDIKKELQLSYFYIIRKNYSYLKYLIIKYIGVCKYFFKGFGNVKYWKLALIIFQGKYLENSLKQTQVIKLLNGKF